jgi:hypothetical protein
VHRSHAAALAAGLALAVALPAHATKYAAEFLKIGVGARALGMGEAYVAVADDPSAAYWNPAGLVFLRQQEVQAMHAEQFGQIVNHDYVSYAHPLEPGLEAGPIVGVTLVRTSIDDIPVLDDANGSGVLQDVGRDGVAGTQDEGEGDGILGPGEYVLVDEGSVQFRSNTDLAFLLSYARPLSPSVNVGVNAKLIRQQLIDNSNFGIGADLGILWTPREWLSVGLRVADVTTTQLSWDTGKRETVVPSTRLGVAILRDVPRLRGVITLAADANTTYEGPTGSQLEAGQTATDFSLGAEYWYNRALALRLGNNRGQFAGGAGVRWARFGVDYAFVGHTDLETTHRVSAQVTF